MVFDYICKGRSLTGQSTSGNFRVAVFFVVDGICLYLQCEVLRDVTPAATFGLSFFLDLIGIAYICNGLAIVPVHQRQLSGCRFFLELLKVCIFALSRAYGPDCNWRPKGRLLFLYLFKAALKAIKKQ